MIVLVLFAFIIVIMYFFANKGGDSGPQVIVAGDNANDEKPKGTDEGKSSPLDAYRKFAGVMVFITAVLAVALTYYRKNETVGKYFPRIMGGVVVFHIIFLIVFIVQGNYGILTIPVIAVIAMGWVFMRSKTGGKEGEEEGGEGFLRELAKAMGIDLDEENPEDKPADTKVETAEEEEKKEEKKGDDELDV